MAGGQTDRQVYTNAILISHCT